MGIFSDSYRSFVVSWPWRALGFGVCIAVLSALQSAEGTGGFEGGMAYNVLYLCVFICFGWLSLGLLAQLRVGRPRAWRLLAVVFGLAWLAVQGGISAAFGGPMPHTGLWLLAMAGLVIAVVGVRLLPEGILHALLGWERRRAARP